MSNIKTFRLGNDRTQKLQEYENQTEVVKEALTNFFTDESVLLLKIQETRNYIDTLNFELKNAEVVLQQYEDKLSNLREQKSFRPPEYQSTLDTLRNVKCNTGKISPDIIRYQAELCHVPVQCYKRWLFDDEVFDEILSL